MMSTELDRGRVSPGSHVRKKSDRSVMVRKGVGFVVVHGQFPEITMDVVGIAAVTFVVVIFGGRETSG